MRANIISIVLLATAVVAHPKRHQHLHHGTGVGTGAGFAMPTGGTYPLNGTHFGGTAISSATGVKTVTVSPVPLESSTEGALSASSAPVANAVAASSASTSSSCSTSLTSTITTTSVQFVTFTATASSVTDEADQDTVTLSASSTTSSAASTSSDSGLEDLSASTSARVSGTVTAGAFFGWPSNGGSSSEEATATASWSESAALTTFATIATIAGSSAASSAAVSATASSASATASATSSSSGSSSGKKGLSFNTASLTDAFAGDGMSWVYNWAAAAGGSFVSGAEYVPMLWGLDSVDDWASAAAAAISSGSEHALSFNEPDLSTQSNIDPQTAATNHIKYMNPLSGQVQIGSPAVTNGAGSSPPMGTTWLSQFFEACNGECKVDFVAFHWYNDASEFSDLQSHVEDVISTAAANGVSKVWLTEFGATGSDSDVASFLSQAVEYLDSNDSVERYAYFMCSDGILLDGTSVSSPIGEAYLG